MKTLRISFDLANYILNKSTDGVSKNKIKKFEKYCKDNKIVSFKIHDIFLNINSICQITGSRTHCLEWEYETIN